MLDGGGGRGGRIHCLLYNWKYFGAIFIVEYCFRVPYSLYVYITWWAFIYWQSALKASNPPNLIFPAIHC